jgi:predicted O-linked N-acetylglucosamine transferase (SPINDLY family)
MTPPRTSSFIPVSQAPCKSKGYVTFGSFQQIAKINDQVLRVWADVMRTLPNSRLRVQNKALDSASISDKFRVDLTSVGIDLSRVDLVGNTSWEEYLAAHREVDILLDTFPYPGGTTTSFALWMGVPTITLEGTTMLSRQGSSMLKCVGLTDWIAKDETEYVDIARRFARDSDAVTQLREQLRAKAQASPLFDCKGFAINLENAIRFMYGDKLMALSSPLTH